MNEDVADGLELMSLRGWRDHIHAVVTAIRKNRSKPLNSGNATDVANDDENGNDPVNGGNMKIVSGIGQNSQPKKIQKQGPRPDPRAQRSQMGVWQSRLNRM